VRGRVGETFEVVLEGSPTAGYRWEFAFAAGDAGRIALLAETWDADTTRVGGPTRQRFQFRALSEGIATLEFRYRRPWEQLPPTEERSVRVEIAGGLHSTS
jgi:predicted secreted protein